MSEPAGGRTTRTIDFTPELDRAYRLYAAKTIEDRALPDVRDGCKPVQRRILYAMYDMGLRSDGPQRKCARIVGEVLGKYHPHGDQSVYGALVRLAQPFSLREPLVDGQGNFGSVDGDGAAAMRYTEARLSALGEALLQDIGAETVDTIDNFDTSLQEPTVLPTAFPNLLVNGSTGIAVGMATNVPPHNLAEIAAAIVHVVHNWARRADITTEELMEHVPGPDFPTGGVVYRFRELAGEVRDTIYEAYHTGRGQIVTQARMHLEQVGGGKTNIVVTELPYMVQTSTVAERIAREVKDGRVSGVTDLRDESDYDKGMRLVVEVSRAARPEAVMADLLRHSQLQETFGCNSLALVPGGPGGGVRPARLSLREMLVHFVVFRLEVITRRSRFELRKREERLHVVQGLVAALAAIDRVVAIIRGSRNPETAAGSLQRELRLTETQARAILDMPLRRLTALETRKLQEEAAELVERIQFLRELLASEERRLETVVLETDALRQRFGSPRRTVIIDSRQTLGGSHVVTEADLRVPQGRQVVILTTAGVERRDSAGFRYARAEGLTSRATTSQLAQVRLEPSDRVLLVSGQGRAWRHEVGFVPAKATFEMLGLARGEAVVCVALSPDDDQSLLVGTGAARVKRTMGGDVARVPGSWSQVVGLADHGDGVRFAGVAAPGAQLLFATRGGYVLRTAVDGITPQASGSARGVAGIALRPGDEVVGGAVVGGPDWAGVWLFVVSENGFVKRVPLEEYPLQGRATRGVQTMRVTAETGPLAALAVGGAADGLDVLFANGRRFSVAAADVPDEGRYHRGRRLFSPASAEAPVVAAVVL